MLEFLESTLTTLGNIRTLFAIWYSISFPVPVNGKPLAHPARRVSEKQSGEIFTVVGLAKTNPPKRNSEGGTGYVGQRMPSEGPWNWWILFHSVPSAMLSAPSTQSRTSTAGKIFLPVNSCIFQTVRTILGGPWASSTPSVGAIGGCGKYLVPGTELVALHMLYMHSKSFEPLPSPWNCFRNSAF